jgi:hypothetical protein
MLGSRIIKGKRVKIRPISAFKPNTPILHYSSNLHVAIPQMATDIPITNSLDSHPLAPMLRFNVHARLGLRLVAYASESATAVI